MSKIKQLKETDDKNGIIKAYHELPLGGHQGIKRTLKRMQIFYRWTGMKNDIEKYIRNCASCQANKLAPNPKIPMRITTTSTVPFQRIYLDIVGPLPISYTNNKYILTFQDDLTKYSEAIPICNNETKTVAETFVTNIVCRHGIPKSILTDQGSNFLSDMFKEVYKLLKIKKVQTTPYHPQTNGALERSHRTLAEYLRHYTNKDQLTWDTWIPYAMFVYNTTPHSSTNYTPHELLYGFPADIPTGLKQEPGISYNYDNYANELKARLQHGYTIAREIIKTRKEKNKQYYDKNTKTKQFNLGEKVLLKNYTRKNKFQPLWTGPYEIIKINSPENTTIKINNKNKTIHNNNLKQFHED